MGIEISAQESSGCLDPHPTLQLPHWEMSGASVHCSILNTTTADPWVHQQHLTFRAHTGFLCGDLKKAFLFHFPVSVPAATVTREQIETKD